MVKKKLHDLDLNRYLEYKIFEISKHFDIADKTYSICVRGKEFQHSCHGIKKDEFKRRYDFLLGVLEEIERAYRQRIEEIKEEVGIGNTITVK